MSKFIMLLITIVSIVGLGWVFCEIIKQGRRENSSFLKGAGMGGITALLIVIAVVVLQYFNIDVPLLSQPYLPLVPQLR